MVVDQVTGEGIIFANDFDGETKLKTGVRISLPRVAMDGLDARHMRVMDDIRPLVDMSPQMKQVVNEGMISAL